MMTQTQHPPPPSHLLPMTQLTSRPRASRQSSTICTSLTSANACWPARGWQLRRHSTLRRSTLIASSSELVSASPQHHNVSEVNVLCLVVGMEASYPMNTGEACYPNNDNWKCKKRPHRRGHGGNGATDRATDRGGLGGNGTTDSRGHGGNGTADRRGQGCNAWRPNHATCSWWPNERI